MKYNNLIQNQLSDYPEKDFLSAVDEAYQKWRENDLYEERVKIENGPDKINSFDDVYNIPVIDMAEFKYEGDPKDHHLAIDNDKIDPELCLYTSGTSVGIQGMAPKSEEEYERQRKAFHEFFREVYPEIDKMIAHLMPKEDMEELPINQRNRSVYKYNEWATEIADKKIPYLGRKNGDIALRSESISKELSDGNIGIISLPTTLNDLMEYLENKEMYYSLNKSAIATAGGWKGEEGLTAEKFRDRIQKVFGVPKENHLDFYGFAECTFPTGNKQGDPDPDKKRVPSQGFVYVADEEHFRDKGRVKPLKGGGEGIAVFVDPLNHDYPGAIMTDDIVEKTGGVYSENVRIEYKRRSSM